MADDVGASPFGAPETRISTCYDWAGGVTGPNDGGPGDPLNCIPSRLDFVLQSDDGRNEHLKILQQIQKNVRVLFHPWDIHESIHYERRPGESFGHTPQRYQLNLLGNLSDGSSARVIINDVPVYFGMWCPDDGDAGQWVLSVTSLLQEHGLERYELGEGFPLRGYRETPRKFVKLFFSNLKQRREAINTVRNRKLETFSDDRSNYFRLFARENFLPLCAWLKLARYEYKQGGSGGRACPCGNPHPSPGAVDESSPNSAHVFVVSHADISGLVNPIAPDPQAEQEIVNDPFLMRERALVLGWDIETYSPYKGLGTPPDANKHDDVTFMLCATVHWRSDPKPLAKVCLTTLPSAPDGRWTTVICGSGRGGVNDQASLIMAFAKLFRLWAPQIVTGFNDGQYDWPFIVEKGNQLGILSLMFSQMSAVARRNQSNEDVMKWNYVADRMVKISAEKRISVSFLKAPGFVPVDARVAYMRLYPKLPTTSLKAFLAKVKLGGKADMPYTHMWKIYEAGVFCFSDAEGHSRLDRRAQQQVLDPDNFIRQMASNPAYAMEEMRHVAHYCIIDATRCQELLVTRTVIKDNCEVGNYSFTSFEDCIFYAGGHKVCNMLFAYAAWSKVHLGRPIYGSMIADREEIEGKYPGAFVVPPDKGLDEDFPVTGLDFSSLYPSLIRTYNFSLEMFVTSEAEAQYYERRGEAIHRVRFMFGGREVCGWFIQHRNNDDKIGIFARALGDLYDKRNSMKDVLKPLDAGIEQFKSIHNEFRKQNPLGADGFRAHLAATFDDVRVQVANVAAQTVALEMLAASHMMQTLSPDDAEKLVRLRKNAKKLKGREKDLYEFLCRPSVGNANDVATLHEVEKHLEDMEFRYTAVDSKQKAVKVFMNTFYGESGNKLSPLFYLPLAGGVTSAGQFNLKLVKVYVESLGYRVKYGDTDSLYLCCPPEMYTDVEAQYAAALASMGIVPPTDPIIETWQVSRAAILARINGVQKQYDDLMRLIGNNCPPSGNPEGNTVAYITSAAFAQANPALGAVVVEANKKLQNSLLDLRTSEQDLGPCPQYTDRFWLHRVFEEQLHLRLPVQAVYETLCTEKVKITMRVMDELRDKVNNYLACNNGGHILKMDYEEVCFPSCWTGKKKYFAIAHKEQPNFHIQSSEDIFIKGIDVVKQGQTRLSKEIGFQCMWDATRLCPPGTRVPLIERIENVIRINCSDLGNFRANDAGTGRWKLDDFIQSDAWKPDKANPSVQKFMKRMDVRHKIQLREHVERAAQGLPPDELDYIQPEPGSRFNYLLVDTPRDFDLRGYASSGGVKKGDLMEYVHVAKQRNSKIDVGYYLKHYVVGLCARFINSDGQFDHPDVARGRQISDKDQDEYSQRVAKRHLEKLVDSLNVRKGGDDQKRGRAYKKAYAQASQKISDALRSRLGASASILLGSEDLQASRVSRENGTADFTYELFLPPEDEESIRLTFADRIRQAADLQAGRFWTELEEHNFIPVLLKSAGVSNTPAGRDMLYRQLQHLQPPAHRAHLRNQRVGTLTHPAIGFDRTLALCEYESVQRLEALEPAITGIAEKLQVTLEALVTIERELEQRNGGLGPGDLADASDDADETSADRAVDTLSLDGEEAAALRETHMLWLNLTAIAGQRIIRARMVEHLHAARDRAL